jgi:hypothetical protein
LCWAKMAEFGNNLREAIAEAIEETASGVVSEIATEHLEDMRLRGKPAGWANLRETRTTSEALAETGAGGEDQNVPDDTRVADRAE